MKYSIRLSKLEKLYVRELSLIIQLLFASLSAYGLYQILTYPWTKPRFEIVPAGSLAIFTACMCVGIFLTWKKRFKLKLGLVFVSSLPIGWIALMSSSPYVFGSLCTPESESDAEEDYALVSMTESERPTPSWFTYEILMGSCAHNGRNVALCEQARQRGLETKK